MNAQTIEGIRFGDFVLDLQGRRLMRGDSRLALGPLEFKLLEVLVKNRKRVLTGDELRVLVWADDPSRNVVPAQDVNALYVSVRKLRAALGDAGKWIVNIPKVGYTISGDAHIEEPSATASSADLPDDLTPFVGRENELALIQGSLLKSRLITLTGAPGVGKTRLAIEAARSIAERFSSGIRFVDLTSVADGEFVSKALLTQFDLPDSPGSDMKIELAEFVRHRSVGLIFDNCEHVIDAASELIEDLIMSGREVHIIATSREPLQLPNETVIMVRPLSVPAPGTSRNAGHLMEFEAVRLFLELAKQRRPDLKLRDNDLPAIAELCRQLEGIPVALELAAVQIDAYPIDQIVSAMADHVSFLQRRSGKRARHKTLEATIDWSYDLLSPDERLLLNRLSVFTGGWTLSIAKEACADARLSENDIVHLLAGLVRRSLVLTTSKRGRHRYKMLEMIRQFGVRRLEDSGEMESMLDRRTAVYVNLAQSSFDDGDRGDWPMILEAEYDNIRSVLTRTITNEKDIAAGLRLSGALSRFWFNHGYINEALHWTELALAKDDGSDATASARCLMAAGFFFGQIPGSQDDVAKRRRYFEQSIELWRALGDRRNLGVTLIGFSFLLNRLGEYEAAINAAEESLDNFRGTEFHFNAARAANNLALTLLDIGEFERARPVLDEALIDSRKSDDVFLEAVCLHNMGDLALQTGELERAAEFLDHSLTLFEELGQRPLVARTRLMKGEVAAEGRDFETALKLQKAAVSELKEIGDNQAIASAFEALATTFAIQGKLLERAVKFQGAAESLRNKIGIGLSPARKRRFDTVMKKVETSIGKPAYRKAIADGRKFTVIQAIDLLSNNGP